MMGQDQTNEAKIINFSDILAANKPDAIIKTRVVPLLESIDKKLDGLSKISLSRKSSPVSKSLSKTENTVKNPVNLKGFPYRTANAIQEGRTAPKPIAPAKAKSPLAPTPIKQKELLKKPEGVNLSKSQEASKEMKDRRERKKENDQLVDTMEETGRKWDGSFGGGGGDDLKDAVGTAGGGVFWGALKEIGQTVSGLGGETKDDSLTGIVKKFVQDKTGITKAKEVVGSARQGIIDKFQNKKEEAPKELPEGQKRDKNGKVRDAQGRFVKQAISLDSVSADRTKEQTEILKEISENLSSSDKANEKRHNALVKTVAAGAAAGGGGAVGGSLLSSFMGGGGGGGILGKIGGKFGGKLGKVGGLLGKVGKLGKFGKIAGLLGGGALAGGGLLSSFMGGGNEKKTIADVATDKIMDVGMEKAAGKISGKVAAKGASELGGKVVGGLGGKVAAEGAAKFGGKGLLKAGASIGGKALRALGPIAAIASAGFDAYQGWNDKEMQQKAFGLKEGQEATTGQKSASALANVLDMGGLITGGLKMVGVDVGTGDIAKNLYESFGGGDPKKQGINSPAFGFMTKALGPLGSVVDAFKGFSDKETQQKAFGLGKDEEATLGQKASTSFANVLNMGGLLEKGLGTLGVKTSTADIAGGIYEFFGGKKKSGKAEKDVAQVAFEDKKQMNADRITNAEIKTVSKPEPMKSAEGKNINDAAILAAQSITSGAIIPNKLPEPESIKKIQDENRMKVSPDKSLSTNSKMNDPAVRNLMRNMERLTKAIEKNKNKSQIIQTDFDDQTLILMSRDRL